MPSCRATLVDVLRTLLAQRESDIEALLSARLPNPLPIEGCACSSAGVRRTICVSTVGNRLQVDPSRTNTLIRHRCRAYDDLYVLPGPVHAIAARANFAYVIVRTSRGKECLAFAVDGDGGPSAIFAPGLPTEVQLVATPEGVGLSVQTFLTRPTVAALQGDSPICTSAVAPPAERLVAGDRWAAQFCEVDADPARPTIITCYGGFRRGLPPYYSPAVDIWVRAGGRYIIGYLPSGAEVEWSSTDQAGSGSFDSVFASYLRMVAALASDHGLQRRSLAGGSFGATLVVQAIFSGYRCSSAVATNGVYDFHDLDDRKDWSRYFPASGTLMSGPTIDTSIVPLLLNYSRSDRTVSPSQSRHLAHALATTRPDWPVRLRGYAGGHNVAESAGVAARMTADALLWHGRHTGIRPETLAAAATQLELARAA